MKHMVQNKNICLEIILQLIKKKSYLREIAREINENHSTVLRNLNNLVKENILDYGIEGKNKVFFLKNNFNARNLIYSAEFYKLSKFLDKHQEMNVIFEDIKKNTSREMILLFGSYAKGIAKKDSDIDIYVETEDNKLKKKIQGLNSKLSVKIGRFDLNSLLIKEIIKNHIVLRGVEDYYEKNKFFESD